MSRGDAERLADVASAIDVIRDHLTRGDLSDGLVYDAVRARLIEIGEAVKGISPVLLEVEPAVPWSAIARMRDHLAHRYFDTDHAIVEDVVPTSSSRFFRLCGRCPNVSRGRTTLRPEREAVGNPLAIHGSSRARIQEHSPDGAPLLTRSNGDPTTSDRPVGSDYGSEGWEF